MVEKCWFCLIQSVIYCLVAKDLSFRGHVCLVVLNFLPPHVKVSSWVIAGHNIVACPAAFLNLSQSKTKFLAILPNKLSEMPAN